MLTVHVTSRVQLQSREQPESTPPWNGVREQLRIDVDAETILASQFIHASPRVPWEPDLHPYVADLFPDGCSAHLAQTAGCGTP